jgi:hypothetical protein
MNVNHFIAVQAGLFEHLKEGKMTPTMFACYCIILDQANYETGFWRGSAPKIEAAWAGQIGERCIQEALKALCTGGYLKSFHTRGRRGNYIVAINKYPVRFGNKNGLRLNAAKTLDPANPVYEPANEPSPNYQGTDITPQIRDLVGTTVCPENGQPPVQAHRGFTEASPQPIAGTNAAPPKDHRTITVGSPHPIAGIPDSSRLFQIAPNQEKPSIPSNQPDSRNAKNNGHGWLVGRVNTLLSRSTHAIMLATERERRELRELELKYGTLPVLMAFYEFLDRDRGIDGLTFPISVFVGEANGWVPYALKRSNLLDEFCKRNPGVLPPFENLCESYSYPSDRQSLLLIMLFSAYESSENGYSEGRHDMKAVEDFLKSSPLVVQVAPHDHMTESPIDPLNLTQST